MKSLFSLLTILSFGLLSGCAAAINGLAPTDCYDARSASISVMNADGIVIADKPADIVRFCPPSIRKVAP